MKTRYVLVAMLLAAVCALAGEDVYRYDVVQWVGDGVAVTTSGNANAATQTKVSGRVRSVSIEVVGTTPTVAVTIVSTDGTGSSIGGAKTIFSRTISADVYTNILPATIEGDYLWMDDLVFTVTNASTNSTTCKAVAVLEK